MQGTSWCVKGAPRAGLAARPGTAENDGSSTDMFSVVLDRKADENSSEKVTLSKRFCQN